MFFLMLHPLFDWASERHNIITHFKATSTLHKYHPNRKSCLQHGIEGLLNLIVVVLVCNYVGYFEINNIMLNALSKNWYFLQNIVALLLSHGGNVLARDSVSEYDFPDIWTLWIGVLANDTICIRFVRSSTSKELIV